MGYTFLMSVLNRGNNNFPLVVDSPANPIDGDVRENIAALIPSLCTQFVGFTINTERPGFVLPLEKAAGAVKYLTMFERPTALHDYSQTYPPQALYRLKVRCLWTIAIIS